MKVNERKMANYRRRAKEVLVDFDGTLCAFNYPKLGPPRHGALEFIQWLIEQGLTPVVWSSRLSADNCAYEQDPEYEQHIQWWAITRWLKEHGFPDLEVDQGYNGKRLALAYVDDRGVEAGELTEWSHTKAKILEIKAHEDARWEEYDAG